ncbi:hypothetical protein MRX96_007512 [Rhipicephalus microplus]
MTTKTTGHLPVSRDIWAAEKTSRASQNIRRTARSSEVLLAEQTETAKRRQDVAQLPPGEDPNLSQVRRLACHARAPRVHASELCGGSRAFQRSECAYQHK